jgi:hypothetical protein
MSGAARAEEYHFYGRSPDGVFFIDSDSLNKKENIASYWATMFLERESVGAPGGHSAGTAFIIFHEQIDCSADKSRHLSMNDFSALGAPLATVNEPGLWTEVVPGTNLALAERLVCDSKFLAADRSMHNGPIQMLAFVRDKERKK